MAARFGLFFCSCLKRQERYLEQEFPTGFSGQMGERFSRAKGVAVAHRGYPWLHTNLWTFDLKLNQGSR